MVFPAGIGPAGYAPIGAPQPSTVTVPGRSVRFDPVQRDFTATNGLWDAVHWVDQAVTFALTIERGALKSVPTQGVRYRQIQIITASVQADVEDMTREALALLLASPPKIDLEAILVDSSTRGQLKIAVQYMNLLTRRRDTFRRAVKVQ